MSVRIFYRYRSMFAHGWANWAYDDVLLASEDEWKEWAQERARELGEEFNWSDKYRQTDVERVDTPPLDYLRAQVKRSEDSIKYHTDRAAELRKLIEEQEQEPTTIIGFFRGAKHPEEGFTRDEALGWPNEAWEKCHSAVQWLFPLPEPSKMHPQAPVATPEDFEAIKADTSLSAKLSWNVGRFETFLRDTDWIHPGNHNLLRITRVIRCLTLAGVKLKAESFHRWCKYRVMERYDLKSDEVPEPWATTFHYWEEALKDKPSWL